jgi:hypothetical protein
MLSLNGEHALSLAIHLSINVNNYIYLTSHVMHHICGQIQATFFTVFSIFTTRTLFFILITSAEAFPDERYDSRLKRLLTIINWCVKSKHKPTLAQLVEWRTVVVKSIR